MNKYVKVLDGFKSNAGEFEYKLNEINIANKWNKNAKSGREFGGFNFTTEDCILRWLHRGNTIYDVEVPIDAEIVKLEGATTIYRTNKIIISNPRKIDDELALKFYKISNIPEKSYYKALGVVSIMGYKNTAYAIIRDKITNNNINEVLEQWNDFISHGNKDDRKNINDLVIEVEKYLYEIKSDFLISRFIDKKPYIKNITIDKIINITGESGSGKSYYCSKYIFDENYIVIDTDIVFDDSPSDNKESIELRKIFNDKPKNYLITNFDDFYLAVLDYFKNINKTIVIDSAQFRNIKNYKILKGKVIVMRTSIETCYKRCIDRWKKNTQNYTTEELEKYKEKKTKMFNWYHSINVFLNNINKIKKQER